MKKFDADYVLKHCQISYQGSEQPQDLQLKVKWQHFNQTIIGILYIEQQLACRGFAADDMFSPLAGEARFVSSSDPFLLSGKGRYRPVKAVEAVLRCASVSEAYVKFLSEILLPGAEMLSITGSLPLGSDRRGLTTDRFLERAENPNYCVGIWGEVPFEVVHEEAAQGASIRIEYGGPIPNDYDTSELGIASSLIKIAHRMITFWNRAGDQAGFIDLMPKLKLTEREVSASWEKFLVRPEPFVALLTNYLVWVHHNEVPVNKVTIRTV
jgi:hypothetical protein